MTKRTLSASAWVTISYPDGRRVTAPLSDCTLRIEHDLIEVTTFGSNQREYVPGQTHVYATHRGFEGVVINGAGFEGYPDTYPQTLDAVPDHDLDPIQQQWKELINEKDR